jgi:hypothetical protein
MVLQTAFERGNFFDSPLHDLALDFDSLTDFFKITVYLEKYYNKGITWIFVGCQLLYTEYVNEEGEVMLLTYNHLARKGLFYPRLVDDSIVVYKQQKSRLDTRPIILPENHRFSETSGERLTNDDMLKVNSFKDLYKLEYEPTLLTEFLHDTPLCYHKPIEGKKFDASYSVWILDEEEKLVTMSAEKGKWIARGYRKCEAVRDLGPVFYI